MNELIRSGTGKAFIIGMPGGAPKPPNAAQQMDKDVDNGGADMKK